MILFDQVILNDGGGLNHGVFTAPFTGYYLFSTSLVHPPQEESLHAGIMHNGLLIALIHANSGVYDQGTQTVVLKVKAGEQVWIENRDYNNEGVHGNAYSSFSGFLLYQL
ncbi:hypothetical protein DPMN_134300 [Dreissena polymorpha]|uniref:C1q domain-containing protein n=1 Tax=Dreissena polymorpha TaxID=45954 RepID=A0A9D4FVX2_DREPO|nr:hypothetical protein DPMN_134300 [Dreissena polymorpha]